MIFGTLNPEKIWRQELVHLPTSPVYSSHFTLGNPKSHFPTILFIQTSDYVRYLRRKQTVTSLPTTPENVTALPCKMHKLFMFFILRVSSTNPRHRLNFSTAWWISGEKDWKHVSVQKMVTLNICCNIVWLTFHLPHITTGSFQSHQCQSTTGFFHSHQRLEECHIRSVRWKSCAFYKVVQWHFSGVVVRGNSLFSSEIM